MASTEPTPFEREEAAFDARIARERLSEFEATVKAWLSDEDKRAIGWVRTLLRQWEMGE